MRLPDQPGLGDRPGGLVCGGVGHRHQHGPVQLRTLRTKNDWLASITGRVGFAVDRALLYWRGGVAWAHNKFEIENTAILDGTPQTTRVGWIIGSGIELALAPCWSAFLEADYYSFNGTTVAFAGDLVNPTPSFGVNTTQNVEAMKFGVNYRFGGATVPAISRY